MKKLTVAILPLIFILSGCPQMQQDAYNVVVAAKAFTDKISAAHPECLLAANASILCADLHRAVSAKDILIDAIEVYCAGPTFNGGGTCSPPAKGTPALAQATAKLQAALANYEQTEKDLKGAIH